MEHPPDTHVFELVRVVLCRPQIPGNIGAVCRSMLNFGPRRLCLVAPECDPLCREARRRARAAEGILEGVEAFDALPDALAGCVLVLGATARGREVERSPRRPGQVFGRACELLHEGKPIALVFGQETSGLSNLELDRCHEIITIPTCGDLSSLNLATAASILLYELHQSVAGRDPAPSDEGAPADLSATQRRKARDNAPASADQLEAMYGQMRDCLEAGHFLNPENPDITIRYLRRFFSHSGCTDFELRLWRAIWKRLNDRIRTPKPRFGPRKEWLEFQRGRRQEVEGESRSALPVED